MCLTFLLPIHPMLFHPFVHFGGIDGIYFIVNGYLLVDPVKGSVCKRTNLFLRWENLPKDRLNIPLDTHMHRICLVLGLTTRKQGDMKTAVAGTRSFARICPDDPVKYDFVLTRLGIRDNMELSHFYDTMGL